MFHVWIRFLCLRPLKSHVFKTLALSVVIGGAISVWAETSLIAQKISNYLISSENQLDEDLKEAYSVYLQKAELLTHHLHWQEKRLQKSGISADRSVPPVRWEDYPTEERFERELRQFEKKIERFEQKNNRREKKLNQKLARLDGKATLSLSLENLSEVLIYPSDRMHFIAGMNCITKQFELYDDGKSMDILIRGESETHEDWDQSNLYVAHFFDDSEKTFTKENLPMPFTSILFYVDPSKNTFQRLCRTARDS